MNKLLIPALLIGFGTALAVPHTGASNSATCHFDHWWSIACTSTQAPPQGNPVGCEPVPGAPVRPTITPTNTMTVLPGDSGGSGG